MMKTPPLWICLLVIVILLALIVYVATNTRGLKHSVSQFENDEPKSMFTSLVSEFGSPQIIINQKGGFAMWFPSKVYENSPYESVILKDENIDNPDTPDTPDAQKGFIYTTIIIHIDERDIEDVTSINKNVYYDFESKEFTVRSDSITNNKRILLSILRYLTNPSMSVSSARNLILNTWMGDVLDNTSFSSTMLSDRDDRDIYTMIDMTIPVGSRSNRVNREFMMSP
jgi:hypothetical protein